MQGSVPFGSGEDSESVEEYVPLPGHYFGSGEGSESVDEDVPSPEHSSFIPARHHHLSSSGLALEKENKEIKRGEEKLDFEVNIVAHPFLSSSSFLSKRWENCKGKQMLWIRSALCK